MRDAMTNERGYVYVQVVRAFFNLVSYIEAACKHLESDGAHKDQLRTAHYSPDLRRAEP